MADPDRSGDIYTSDTPAPGDTNHGGTDINGKDPGHQTQYGDGFHISRGGKDSGGKSEERDGWHYTDHKTKSHDWPD